MTERTAYLIADHLDLTQDAHSEAQIPTKHTWVVTSPRYAVCSACGCKRQVTETMSIIHDKTTGIEKAMLQTFRTVYNRMANGQYPEDLGTEPECDIAETLRVRAEKI